MEENKRFSSYANKKSKPNVLLRCFGLKSKSYNAKKEEKRKNNQRRRSTDPIGVADSNQYPNYIQEVDYEMNVENDHKCDCGRHNGHECDCDHNNSSHDCHNGIDDNRCHEIQEHKLHGTENGFTDKLEDHKEVDFNCKHLVDSHNHKDDNHRNDSHHKENDVSLSHNVEHHSHTDSHSHSHSHSNDTGHDSYGGSHDTSHQSSSHDTSHQSSSHDTSHQSSSHDTGNDTSHSHDTGGDSYDYGSSSYD